MNSVAIIPARGGSKRIPDKNIIDFLGKPMIVHTLDNAREAGVFNKIVVSTDNEKIRKIVMNYGYEVIERPPELATDTSSIIPVVLHALDELAQNGEEYENACLLMANCPLRDANDMSASWESFESASSSFMMSVFKYGMFYPFWALCQTEEGLKSFFAEKYFRARSQDLPAVCCPSGAIRWFKVKDFSVIKDFYGPNLKPFFMPWYKAIDIDDYDDLMMAKVVVKAMKTSPNLFG